MAKVTKTYEEMNNAERETELHTLQEQHAALTAKMKRLNQLITESVAAESATKKLETMSPHELKHAQKLLTGSIDEATQVSTLTTQ